MRHELSSSDRQADLDAVLADVMQRLDADEPVDRESLIAAHPELAEELRAHFSDATAVHRLAAGITANFTHQATPRRALEVRCPNCHAPMEVAVDTALTDLTCPSCGSHFSLVDQSKATRMAPPLLKLGRFELIERIGVGGFGSVWKARDKELDRTVAIKIPRAGDMTAEEQEKFFREARAAAQLRHPNIVSVHEVGRDGDSVYIVSNFVRGVTLGDWLTGQQLTSREAAELCAKIADALHHAHEQGVVHRDLKPANIMIDADGQPHLMDFGLARREVGEVTVTMDGQVLGTPAYMSPEQAQGEAHTADRRSDIYSLGVILFQLLTGELPFRGNARMIMHQVIHDEPPSPRKFNGNIHRDLETITLKCLEKDAAKRYATANALADEFRRFKSGQPIQARAITRLSRGWRWAKRNPMVASLSAALLVLLSTVAIVGPLMAVQQAELRRAAESDKRAAQDERRAADQERLKVQEQLANNLFERASTEYSAMRIGPGISLLERAYETAAAKSELRTAIRTLMANWSIQSPRSIMHDNTVLSVSFSKDGHAFATGSRDGTVCLWDAESGKRLLGPLRHDAPAHSVAINPDGKLLLTGSRDKTARLWDMQTGNPVGEPLQHEADVLCVAFSPDGKTALTGSGNSSRGEARLWDLQTRKRVGSVMRHEQDVFSVAFTPDGNYLATGSFDGTARLWHATTCVPVSGSLQHEDQVWSVAFSPDNRLLLTGSWDGTSRLWDVNTGDPVGEPMRDPSPVMSVAFSPDGKHLATGSFDNMVRIWDVDTRKQVGAAMPHNGAVRTLAFHPDGSVLLTGSTDRAARLWNLGYDNRIEKFQCASPVRTMTFNPHGEILLTANQDGSAQIWNASTGESIHKPVQAGGTIQTVKFSADGRIFLTGTDQGIVRTWNVFDGKLITEMRIRTAISSIDCTPDGRRIITCGGSDAANYAPLLWDGVTGKSIDRPLQHISWVMSVAVSPNGRTVLTGCWDGVARLWSFEDGNLLHVFRHDGAVNCARFSLDGRVALTASNDQTVQLWDVETGKRISQPLHHGVSVKTAEISPDGKIVLTRTDESVRLWDASTGKPIGSIPDERHTITCAALCPGSMHILVAYNDGRVLEFNPPSALPDIPPLVRAWSRARTGYKLDDHGVVKQLSQAEWLDAQIKLEQLRGDKLLP
jgi:WD40 repeat protein